MQHSAQVVSELAQQAHELQQLIADLRNDKSEKEPHRVGTTSARAA